MTDVVGQLIAQWGLTGVVIAAACYIIWDSWKNGKKKIELFEKKAAENNKILEVINIVSKLADKLDKFMIANGSFKKDIYARLDILENPRSEMEKLSIVSNLGAEIHQCFREYFNDSEIDHVALMLLHNGTHSLSGIPFVKYSIVVEKYRPLQNLNDISLSEKYHNVDIMEHDKLPRVLLQDSVVCFDIDEAGPLMDIDVSLYAKCKQLGIKQIIFGVLYDVNDNVSGSACAYSFDKKIDKNLFVQFLDKLSIIYKTSIPKK